MILAGGVLDVRSRPSSVETVVRRYFTALEHEDVAGALATIAPPVRASDVAFVENSVGNRYRVTGIAVRQPSALERLRSAGAGPTEVTIFLDITQVVDDARWQAGPRVAVQEIGGAWYLVRPPLAPAG